MSKQFIFRGLLIGLLSGAALAIAGVSVSVVFGTTSAFAQLSPEFQEALAPYGEWRQEPRYGEVWVPTGLPPDWRPYEYGHWVYTDEWGWYWVSDDTEEDWGWVTYHYGRWAFDRGIGWFWVPGDDWAPAWVDWRYGDDTVGWAPLPPDNVDIDAYEAEPSYWVFVPDRYIIAPRLRRYFVPRERREFFLRRTHTVNRTLRVNGARIAVNPGISPAFVARATHEALPTYHVQPRVFGSTQGVAGAVRVRPEELRGARRGGSSGALHVNAVSVQRTTNVIRATTAVTPPQPLNKGEHGRLGSQPPRAAQGGITPQQQQPLQLAPAGTPPRTGAPPVQRSGPAPAVAPAPAPVQPKALEERREVHPPAGAGGPPPQPGPKQPVTVQPAPQPHPASPPPPPRVIQALPPPPVHAPPPPPPPPPVVHAPPPPPASSACPAAAASGSSTAAGCTAGTAASACS